MLDEQFTMTNVSTKYIVAIIIRILKNCPTSSLNNFRPISVISNIAIMFEKIIKTGLTTKK